MLLIGALVFAVPGQASSTFCVMCRIVAEDGFRGLFAGKSLTCDSVSGESEVVTNTRCKNNLHPLSNLKRYVSGHDESFSFLANLYIW